jgi:GntR family transcriptional regulator, transcriptional repressor for pyruvate dehydrogenase complex
MVMAEIQRVFVKRNLKLGDHLHPERELARQLSVDRLSLREAMQGLQTIGPVEVRHGVGTFFTSERSRWLLSPLRFSNISPRRLFAELIEARLLVEVRLAALAAERVPREDIARIKEAAERRAHAARDQHLETGLDFPLAVASAAHQVVLATMLKAVCNHYSEVQESLDRAAEDVEAAFQARRDSLYDRGSLPIGGRRGYAGASARASGGVSSIIEPSSTAYNEREVAQ